MDFEHDIKQYIDREFDFFGISVPSEKSESLLLKLFTIQQKYVHHIPRLVKISNELKKQLRSSKKYLEVLISLKMKIENGKDVNSHQSRNLYNFHVHDQLVYHWNIFHFHLDLQMEVQFTKRTKEVVFVYIDNEKALFLKIEKHPPHEIFADKALLEIIDNNWPQTFPELKNVVGLSHDLTNEERFKLRKHGITEGPIEVNGKFFFTPGLGQMTSGHSAQASLKLLDFQRWRLANEQSIKNKRGMIDDFFIQKFQLIQKPNYKMIFDEQGPKICDTNSGICLLKYKEQFVSR